MTASILIVDDSTETREALTRRLRRAGYHTVACSNGTAGLRTIEVQHFDVVLLDLRMPDMNGIEVLDALRKHYRKSELPVLVISAETSSSTIVEALEHGANDYISKPINMPVAIARIEALLSLRDEAEKDRLSARLSPSGPLEKGHIVGDRYRIDGLIGEGGYALVYRAVQLQTEQVVAIKVLRLDRVASRRKGASEIARFEQELRAIGSLNHPHIVRLIDSGRIRMVASRSPRPPANNPNYTVQWHRPQELEELTAGESSVPFMVVEFLEGETLAELLVRDGRMTIPGAVDLMLPLLSALGAVHDKQIVHRDIKPHNILLARTVHGIEPQILDFGIAKLVGEGIADITVTARILGTPLFMSPEQATGTHELLPAADQYSAAVTLYRCIVGRSPYEVHSMVKLVHAVAKAEWTAPREVDPSIPAPLEDIMTRALARRPEDRFSTVKEFGRELLAFASATGRARWRHFFAGD